jgi:hypothetical protein
MHFTAKTALFSAALALATLTTQAHAYVKSNLVVQPLTATATNDAEDLLLHADDDGNTYLYVEQQKGALLSVYDVSDPARIKLKASVQTGAHGAYDFVNTVGNGELVTFRDGSGSTVIDLHKAKAPRLTVIAAIDGSNGSAGSHGPTMQAATRLGTEGYLASDVSNVQPVARVAAIAPAPHVVQVVETASTPRVLACPFSAPALC